ELNPIEQFSAIVKSSVKRSKFDASKHLHTSISNASNVVPKHTLRNCILYSVNIFSKYLNKDPV
ncbi:hypothetical protein BCV71DRAFT_157347, partial [Rhizopus microsporus]